jgi:hypothetical protein
MKQLIHIAFFVFVCSSCQKELKPANFNDPGNPTGIPSSTDSSWQPFSKDSYWKYRAANSPGEITILTSTGITQIFNGKSFNIFNVEKTGQLPGQAFFSKQDNRYELRNIFTRMEMANPRLYSGFIYLIDNAPSAGDTWEYDAGISSNSQPAKITGEIYSTTLTATVAGKVYKNVMLVKLKALYKLDAQSGYENYQSYYFYLVRGVGIIKTEAQSTGGGTNSFNITEELIDYKIY